jgi:hypothetical protein
MELYRIQLYNVTDVNMFILMGFTDDFDLQVILFLLFLAIYLFTVNGNSCFGHSHLHNPMYYFLSVLLFLDSCYSTYVTPKILVNFLASNKSITYGNCLFQMFFLVNFGSTECFLWVQWHLSHMYHLQPSSIQWACHPESRCYSSLLPILVAFYMLPCTQWSHLPCPSVDPRKLGMCSVKSIHCLLFLVLKCKLTSFSSTSWVLLKQLLSWLFWSPMALSCWPFWECVLLKVDKKFSLCVGLT